MNGLLFAPDRDTPDETDSGEFVSRARSFVSLHGGAFVSFDNEKPMRARALMCLGALAEHTGDLSYIGTCCHGWGTGVQAGFVTAQSHMIAPFVDALADAMAHAAVPSEVLTVPLYSCSTASDITSGFAATLSRLLYARGVRHRVYGHTTAGHATRNPYVRVWGEGWDARPDHPHLLGGSWLIDPTSAEWKPWVHALHQPGNDLDLRFVFMSRDAIAAELHR